MATSSSASWTLSRAIIRSGWTPVREDILRDWIGDILLSGDAIWIKERGGHISEVGEQDVPVTLGASMEVYIDDMLVKSVKAELHVDHLAKSFQVLKDYKMKLNPTNYAFGVSAGKFLGFIINSCRIEANLNKIKVVVDMQPPSNTKEIQRLTGRIAALSHFVSRSSDKCQPFFQVLKKAFHWDTHCEEAFSALKTYLSSPLLLVSPSEEEPLTLYLDVFDFSTSAALVREWDRA